MTSSQTSNRINKLNKNTPTNVTVTYIFDSDGVEGVVIGLKYI